MSSDDMKLRPARMAPLAAAALICVLPLAVQPAAAVTLGNSAIGTPALAVFNNNLYIAWTGTDGNNTLNIAQLDASGTSIVTQTTVGSNHSFTGPALAAFNGYLYLAWDGSVSSGENLNIAYSSDGLDFTSQGLVGSNTSFAAPALAASANALYIAWSGNDPSHTVNAEYLTSGLSFTGQVVLSGTFSDASPALAVYGNYLYLGYEAASTEAETLLAASITPPLSFSSTGIPVVNGSGASGAGLGTVNGELFLGWAGQPNTLSGGLNVATFEAPSTSSQAISLVTQETITNQSRLNVAVAGYNGHLYVAWTGTDSNSTLNIDQVY